MASLGAGGNTSFVTGPLAKPLISHIAELMKLAVLHSSDTKKGGKQARKNRPKPDISHMTGERGIMQA